MPPPRPAITIIITLDEAFARFVVLALDLWRVEHHVVGAPGGEVNAAA